MDSNTIGFVAYASYDIMIQSFPGDSPILKQLSPERRNSTFEDVTTDMMIAFRDNGVAGWTKAMEDADFQSNMYIVFSGILSVLFATLLPWFLAERLVTFAVKAFYRITPEVRDFILNDYLPLLKESVSQIHISSEDKKLLGSRIFSILMKAAWAFTFVESIFPLPSIFKHTLTMDVAAFLMPVYNRLANDLSGFPQTDSDFNHGIGVYPGDSHCRSYSPHSMWHEEGAHLMFDISIMSNYVNQIIQRSVE